MQPLPSTFYSAGWNFTLIKRTGNVVLFSKHKRGHKLTHYEVAIVQRRKARTFPNGDTYPEHEAMPSSEEWGTHGWCPYDLSAAHKRFDRTVRELARA